MKRKKKKAVFTGRPHVKKNDIVEVISGDDAGKKGKVLQVLPTRGRAVVEGINVVKKHMRKTQENPNGGIVEKEAPLALSKLRRVGDTE